MVLRILALRKTCSFAWMCRITCTDVFREPKPGGDQGDYPNGLYSQRGDSPEPFDSDRLFGNPPLPVGQTAKGGF